jgi:lipopolysaccharide transport system ATP-binding protein
MYLRLAFAVAAHLEPEILLVDEVLAVGDAAFQRKCTGKMSDVAREGRTVLFVSHNMAAMRQLCSSAVLLSAGRVATTGDTADVIRAYLSSSLSVSGADLSTVERTGAGDVRFSSMRFEDEDGNDAPGLISGRPGRIVLGLSCNRAFHRVRACVAFLDNFNQKIMSMNSYFVREDFGSVGMDTDLVCDIPRVSLAPGRYRVELWLQSSTTTLQDRITDAGSVDVVEGNFFGTGKAAVEGVQLALTDYSWTLREARRPVAMGADCGCVQ